MVEITKENGVYAHPSFGSISWSRQQWGQHKAVLFQSEMSHKDVISIKINRAEEHRSLARNWIFGTDQIAEVLLSPAQFAEFITSPNRGTGSPCTIQWTEMDGHIDLVEQESNYERFKKEAAEDLEEIPARITKMQVALNAMQAGKYVKRSDIREVTSMVNNLEVHLLRNMPFLKTQFDEHMAKVISDSKQEVEAYISNRIHDAGLERIKTSAPHLLTIENE